MGPQAFRAHFPIFADQAHLCSCSEGALSDRVIAAMDDFMTSWRQHGAPWHAWMEQVDAARTRFAQLIHADPSDVAAISCASEGAYHVAASLDWRARPEVVSCDLEFPSIAHVWLAQGARGARVRRLPATDGIVAPQAYHAAIGGDTGLVSVPLVSYANGHRWPVEEIVRTARARGALTFVDAYQGAGVVPLDVRRLDCDFLVAGSLKYLLGAPGIAFLYVRRELADRLTSPLTGWFARREPFAFDPGTLDHAPGARRFQTGTPSIPAAFAAAAGLSLILETDRAAVWRHVQDLASDLQQRFDDAGVALYSPQDPALRGPQIAVRTDRAEQLGAFLQERGVIVSPRGRAVRVSLHYYNDKSDLDRLFDGVMQFDARHGLLAAGD